MCPVERKKMGRMDPYKGPACRSVFAFEFGAADCFREVIDVDILSTAKDVSNECRAAETDDVPADRWRRRAADASFTSVPSPPRSFFLRDAMVRTTRRPLSKCNFRLRSAGIRVNRWHGVPSDPARIVVENCVDVWPTSVNLAL